MVRSPTCTAVSASISTPVRAVHSTVARHTTRDWASSSVNSIPTAVIGTGWHSGTSSEVRLAAWIAAMRATPSTSPFFEWPERTSAKVAGSMRIDPVATAIRCVSAFSPTSTIRAVPRSSKWVSFSVIIKRDGSSKASRLVIARSLLVAPLMLLALACGAQGLPDLGDISSATLSEQQERTIGNRIMREVRNDPAYIDDPEIADYIGSLGARLMAGADQPRRDVDYFVIQEDTINAF